MLSLGQQTIINFQLNNNIKTLQTPSILISYFQSFLTPSYIYKLSCKIILTCVKYSQFSPSLYTRQLYIVDTQLYKHSTMYLLLRLAECECAPARRTVQVQKLALTCLLDQSVPSYTNPDEAVDEKPLRKFYTTYQQVCGYAGTSLRVQLFWRH